jgi:hypothetical protein
MLAGIMLAMSLLAVIMLIFIALLDGRFGGHFTGSCLQFIETPFNAPQLCPNR